MKHYVLLCTLLCGVLVFAACGGSSSLNDLEPQPAGSGNMPIPAADGLPSLDELEQLDSSRSLSIAGPGWYTLDLFNRSWPGMEDGASQDGASLDLEGSGQAAYCVWGVHGFDGDAFATSLRTDVSGVNGEYYLAHTNYIDGRWQVAGPFSESTTYEYPEVSELTGADILNSKYHNHFVAMIVPDGSSLQLDMLQVGVHGGSNGPKPLNDFRNKSNEDRITISWDHSESYLDPDFAGYTVERTTFPISDYVLLTPEHIFDNFYNDEDAPLNTTWVYRVTVWDTAGNTAPSFSYPAQRIAGGTSEPVCVVDMPNGPLTGPAKVTIDLSRSFDNDGDAFTEYFVDFGLGLGEVSQLVPEFTETLQPGCYSLRCRVTAGGQSDTKHMMLKVYPAWEDSSQLVDEGTVLVYRNFAPRAFYDPVSEKSVFLMSDAAVPSVVSLTVDADGNVDRNDWVHIFEDGQLLCSEPKMVGDKWIFMLANADQVISCTWQDNQVTPYIGFGASTDTAFTAVVTDGGNGRWGIYQQINVGYDIKIVDFNTLQSIVLVPGLLNGNFLDAAWNPDAEAIDLIYSGSGSTEWLRWSPVIGPMGNFSINASDSNFVDIEVDPATGRPALLLSDGVSILYSELNDDDATWTAPEKVDPLDPDWIQAKLVYRNGTAYCFFGDNPGGSSLYRRNGANWDVINDADYADGGFFCALSYIPDVPGFQVLDIGLDFGTRITQMQEDGTETELAYIDGYSGVGREMSATSSPAGLHLLHKPLSNYLHLTSPDGVAWTETTDAGLGTGGHIVTDQNGEVYASLINGGNVYLRHWVDPAWIDVEDNPISNNSQPLIYGQGNALVFGNFDGDAVPDEFHFKRDLDPVIIFNPDTTDIWEGAMAGENTNAARMLVRYDGFNFNSGNVGILDLSGNLQYLFEPSFEFFDDPWTLGRHYEGAFYRNQYHSSREVFYTTYGPDAGLVRVYRNDQEEWTYDSFAVVSPEIDPTNHRRTVSATTAWGDSAVGIGSSLEGHVFFFEWDNFGDFEALPLPAGLEGHSSRHELVVGPDGRWHIIYYDYWNDDIRIISTVS
ncbi:MAG: hypothetical protein H7A35_02135 [Planctomycetales bacterium]|nr:hypothetical protein [bacterium]UNM08858.1 MAG: hypothetical protein H7A35_02135 [Planctomycetales bacterium]